MEALYGSNFQIQNKPTAIKYRQYLVTAAFTNILETKLQEREQAQKKLEELTKRVIGDLEHSTNKKGKPAECKLTLIQQIKELKSQTHGTNIKDQNDYRLHTLKHKSAIGE